MAILTISREYGSGGREIGQAVSLRLGYEYLDKDRILEELGKAGQDWEEWGKDLDEHRPSIWERYDWSFRGLGALVQKIILEYAARDRVVIMGRGGSFLLKNIHTALRIRVVASLESRTERIMRRESVDRGTAQWLSKKIDHDRACFIHGLYGGHWDDRKEFDLLFDTSQGNLDEIVGSICDSLAEKDQHKNAAVQELLDMLVLTSKVRAGLCTDPGLFLATLEVDFDGVDIVLRGVVHNRREHRRVEETARKLAEGHSLRCELHYRV